VSAETEPRLSSVEVERIFVASSNVVAMAALVENAARGDVAGDEAHGRITAAVRECREERLRVLHASYKNPFTLEFDTTALLGLLNTLAVTYNTAMVTAGAIVGLVQLMSGSASPSQRQNPQQLPPPFTAADAARLAAEGGYRRAQDRLAGGEYGTPQLSGAAEQEARELARTAQQRTWTRVQNNALSTVTDPAAARAVSAITQQFRVSPSLNDSIEVAHRWNFDAKLD
jgi:hypothetical protein